MAITVNTTQGTSITVSVSGTTQTTFTTTTNSISVTSPTSSTISVLGKGVKGDAGDTGPAGEGFVSGGTENQFIQKNSAVDYDTKWSAYTLPAADGDDGQVLTTNGAATVTFAYPKTIAEDVKNVSGGPLTKGTPVHVTGSVGNLAEVIAADAATNYPAHFVLNEDLADDAEGLGIAIGFINNVDVPDASIYTEGQTVYLGESGGWSTTKPTGAGNAIQNLGIIIKVNTSGNKISGIIMGAGRANDVPNIATGNIWAGNADGVATATSVAYIDIANSKVGIGTTSPLGKLHVENSAVRSSANSGADNIVIEENGYSGITILSNSANAGQIHFGDQDAENVGMIQYFHSDNSMRFATGNASEKLRIDSSGNVGIGTTSPGALLNIESSTSPVLRISNGGGTSPNPKLEFYRQGGVTANVRYDVANKVFILDNEYASGIIDFKVANSNKMRIDSSGNVGVGTTSPNAKLDVAGSIRSSLGGSWASSAGGVQITYDGVDTGTMSMYYDAQDLVLGAGVTNKNGITISGTGADNKISMKAGGSDRVTVLGSSGNVGIGTASPQAKLHLNSGSDNGILLENGNAILGNTGSGYTELLYWSNGNAYYGRQTNSVPGGVGGSVDSHSFRTGGQTRLIIDSSGDVGIGTSTPGQKLEVDGFILLQNNDEIRFKDSVGTERTAIELDPSNDLNIGTSAGGNLKFINGSTYAERMRIDSSGNVGIGTTSPSAKLDVVGLANINDGSNNVMISSGNTAMTSGVSNTAVGTGAGLENTSGTFNVYVGQSSGRANTYSSNNSFVGVNAGRNNTAASNTALGFEAAYTNTSGTGIAAVGYQALRNSTGDGNTAVGYLSGYSATGDGNSFFGNNAGTYTTGDYNVLLGKEAGYGSATSVYSNTVAIGYKALHDLTTGDHNTSIGHQSSDKITTGGYNVSLGNNALRSNLTASGNTALGYAAAYKTTSGGNTAVGYLSAYEGQTHNAALGYRSLTYSTGSYNTAVGSYTAQGTSGSSTFSNTVAVGYEALTDLTTGATNTAVGYRAGANINIGSGNTAIGYEANYNGTSNDGNTAVGKSTLYNTTGSLNVAIGGGAAYGGGSASFSNTVAVGYQALYDLTSGAGNTAVGYQASTNINSGANNTAVGYQAGYAITSGSSNSFFGTYAGVNSTGSNNTAIGHSANFYNTTGSANVVIGREAALGASGASTFSNTVAIGYQALYDLTSGASNTAIGYQAGYEITTANYNTAVGLKALQSTTTSGYNTAIGVYALQDTTASNAVAVGYGALQENTTGSSNTGLGYRALASNLTGSNNTAVGNTAGVNITTANNTVVGFAAGSDISGLSNTAIGWRAGEDNGGANTALGREAARFTTGDNNVAIGFGAAEGVEGVSNFNSTIAIGYQALYDLTSGIGNTAIGYLAATNITSGNYNTALGYQALINQTTDSRATAIGYKALEDAGFSDTAVGYAAGRNAAGGYSTFIGASAGSNVTGVSNTFVGYAAGQSQAGANGGYSVGVGSYALYNLTTGGSNVALGDLAGYSVETGNGNVFLGKRSGYYETGNNKLYIANSDTTTPLIYGEFDNEILNVNGKLKPNSITVDDEGLSAAGDYGPGAEIWYEGTSTPSAGFCYYLDSTGGWTAAQANASGTATGMLAVSAGTDSDVDGMVLRGFVQISNTLTGSVGDAVYLETSAAGRFTTTKPTGAGNFVRRVGYLAKGTNVIYFNPSPEWEAL